MRFSSGYNAPNPIENIGITGSTLMALTTEP